MIWAIRPLDHGPFTWQLCQVAYTIGKRPCFSIHNLGSHTHTHPQRPEIDTIYQ